VVIEALLFRSMIAASNELAVPRLHWTAAAVLGGLLIVTTWLEVPLAGGLMRVGRRIENRLRLELFRRIPRLGDRYFHSRPVSDMAERSHSLHSIRHLPSLVVRLVRSLAETGFIVCAMFWLAPRSGWIAAVIALVGLLLPLTIVPLLTELDLRLRTHTGAVMRYVLDAGLGLTSIRAHTSERAVRRQHEALVTEWARARLNLDRVRSYLVLMQGAVGVIGAAVLVATSVSRIDSPADSLLCAYWALRMSALGEDVVSVVLQYPRRRSVTTRVMEPLTATTEPVGQQSDPVALDVDKPSSSGVDLDFVDVTVRAGGQTILEQVNLSVAAGQHVAIVGASGAGKSSLVGVLLGWHRPASGHVMVQHQAITSERLAGLRGSTAWIDPEVHLWNRSALENLLYGASSEDGAPLVTTIEAAELLDVIDRLPNGLQTPLGEGGGLVSGGEGQRIRFGRMLRRVGCPLVILDEPFRGLDRPARARLLTRARALWRGSTLLCITHDVSETLTFDRVLVLEGGKLVEDLDPSRLESSAAPRFHQMLTAEQSVRRDLWRNPVWRRVRLEGGRLREAD
jgi:ABC-type multidrug transport system fused ATPase/permease subunit